MGDSRVNGNRAPVEVMSVKAISEARRCLTTMGTTSDQLMEALGGLLFALESDPSDAVRDQARLLAQLVNDRLAGQGR